MNKFSCTIFATVTSSTPLSRPMTIPYNGGFKTIKHYPQESVVQIDFPSWPVPKAQVIEALNALRGQIGKVAIDHLEQARNKTQTQILVEPVVFEKLDKYQTEQIIDKTLGFSHNHIKERHEHTLDGFYITLVLPYLGRTIETEFTIQQAFDKHLKDNVMLTLNKKGIVS